MSVMHQNQIVYEQDDQKDRLNFRQKYFYLVPTEVPWERGLVLQKKVQLPALASLGRP